MLDFNLRPEAKGDPPSSKTCDLLIMGGGPAGLTAGLYAARAGLDTLLVEQAAPGGQMAISAHIENYPGFDGPGPELAARMHQQAIKFGVRILTTEITSVQAADGLKQVGTTAGDYQARSLILAMGARYADLGIPGEKEYKGRGISYCATCDGPFFKDKVVAVVGGGNSAAQETEHLTRLASKIIIIHRRDTLRATKVLQERLFSNPKVEFRWDTVVEKIEGDGLVRKLCLRNVRTGGRSELPVSGVFILVGLVPNSELVKGQVELDERGYIVTSERMETNLPGVFAAGDIRRKQLRQVVVAAAEGAIAAVSTDDYLRQ